jgi:Tfp pilus assembly protein PilZ
MGISVIVIAYKEVDNNEGRMKFANVPTHLQSILSIAGLDKAIDIYATEDLAMASFKEDKIIEDIKKMQLRRRFKRLPIGIKVDIVSQNPNGPQCLKVDVCNLSALGAYIYGCDKFELGDEVILKLKLSPHAKEMELTAKVVWLSDKQIQPQFHPGMGIAFHKISTSVQQKLVNFIDKNLSRMPSD